MKQKNTDGSFWPVLFTLFFAAIMVLMAVSVLLGLASGEMSLDNLSGSGMDRAAFLLNGLKSFVLLGIVGWAFWMGWKEVRKRRRAAQARWWQMGWKTIAAFLVFALIAALGFAIRIESDSLGEWLLIYTLYLLAACLVLALPCFLIYSLGKSLGEREMEQEERNEAKKY